MSRLKASSSFSCGGRTAEASLRSGTVVESSEAQGMFQLIKFGAAPPVSAASSLLFWMVCKCLILDESHFI